MSKRTISDPSPATLSLESVLRTAELERRPPRKPDYETENRVLVALSEAMAESPDTILQTLAQKMLQVLGCHSAGVSLLTSDEQRFFWPAVAGAWEGYVGQGTPRDFGPCGDVLDCDSALLFHNPERRYTYLEGANPAVEECLLVPFTLKGKTVGTIWAVTHGPERLFDSEDLRQLQSLSRFASTAYQTTTFLEGLEQRAESLRDSHARLKSARDTIEAELEVRTCALKESEERFQSLVKHIPGAVYRADARPPWMMHYFSSPILAITGYPAEEFVQSERPWTSLIHPEDLERTLEEVMRAAPTRQHFEAQYRILRSDGDIRWVSDLGSFVYDAEGEPLYVEGAIFDISAQKEAEQVRMDQQRAEAASQAKSEFFATLSHELRTPLNGVLGMSGLLAGTALDAEQQEYASAIDSCARVLLETISDVLDMSRIEAGKLELESAAFGLRELVEEARSIVSGQALIRGLTLEIVWDTGLPARVVGDRIRLRQVLLNLISNAVKFTKHGKVTVRCGLAGDNLRFEVQDTGTGISPEDQERLFQAFSQLESDRRSSGTGLGLSIVRTLVEGMGGRLGVQSVLDQGSNFWLEIPLVAALADSNELGAVAQTTSADTGTRILVVEDNPVNRRVLTLQLGKLGYKVESVDDGLKAVEAAENGDYHLILMDSQLPGIDGREATRRIRALGVRSRILALTADASAEERARCLESGMDDYLAKPVEVQRLEQVVRRWTGQE